MFSPANQTKMTIRSPKNHDQKEEFVSGFTQIRLPRDFQQMKPEDLVKYATLWAAHGDFYLDTRAGVKQFRQDKVLCARNPAPHAIVYLEVPKSCLITRNDGSTHIKYGTKIDTSQIDAMYAYKDSCILHKELIQRTKNSNFKTHLDLSDVPDRYLGGEQPQSFAQQIARLRNSVPTLQTAPTKSAAAVVPEKKSYPKNPYQHGFCLVQLEQGRLTALRDQTNGLQYAKKDELLSAIRADLPGCPFFHDRREIPNETTKTATAVVQMTVLGTYLEAIDGHDQLNPKIDSAKVTIEEVEVYNQAIDMAGEKVAQRIDCFEPAQSGLEMQPFRHNA